jgi:hypothetical protein
MFGSDQMVWAEVIGRSIAAVDAADFLMPEQKLEEALCASCVWSDLPVRPPELVVHAGTQ